MKALVVLCSRDRFAASFASSWMISCEPPVPEKRAKKRKKKKLKDYGDEVSPNRGLATPGRQKFTKGGGSHAEFFDLSTKDGANDRIGGSEGISVTSLLNSQGKKSAIPQSFAERRRVERTRTARFYHANGSTEAG